MQIIDDPLSQNIQDQQNGDEPIQSEPTESGNEVIENNPTDDQTGSVQPTQPQMPGTTMQTQDQTSGNINMGQNTDPEPVVSPGGPETLPTVVTENPVNQENLNPPEIPVKQEIQKSPEIKTAPPPPLPETQNIPQTDEGPKINDKDVDKAVVDRTEELTQLHSIENTSDNLTKFADEEEEEFIQGVEAAHGNK